MDKTIQWFGGLALLAAGGIAALVATANAQDITLTGEGSTGVLTAPQAGHLGSVVSACWAGTLAGVDGVTIQRGRGPDVGRVFVAVAGSRTLTRAQARAHLLAGGTLEAGRTVRETVRCEVTQPGHLAALGSLAAAYWPGGASTLQSMSFGRTPDGVVVHFARGQVTRDVDDAVTDSENGSTIKPTGVVQ